MINFFFFFLILDFTFSKYFYPTQHFNYQRLSLFYLNILYSFSNNVDYNLKFHDLSLSLPCIIYIN
jgi:hypothetical protein